MRTTGMLGTGMVLIGVPLSVGYSFHCMRNAEDRILATIAFVLSLISLAWVAWFAWQMLT